MNKEHAEILDRFLHMVQWGLITMAAMLACGIGLAWMGTGISPLEIMGY